MQTAVNYASKPCTLSGDVDLVLPFEKLNSVKWDYKIVNLRDDEKNDDFEESGSSTLTYNKDKTIKLDGTVKSKGKLDCEHPHEHNLKLTLTVFKNPPITLEDQVKYEPADGKVKIARNTVLSSGDKEVKITIDPLIYDKELTHVELKAKASTPYEKLRNIDLELKHEVALDRSLFAPNYFFLSELLAEIFLHYILASYRTINSAIVSFLRPYDLPTVV